MGPSQENRSRYALRLPRLSGVPIPDDVLTLAASGAFQSCPLRNMEGGCRTAHRSGTLALFYLSPDHRQPWPSRAANRLRLDDMDSPPFACGVLVAESELHKAFGDLVLPVEALGVGLQQYLH